MATNDHWREYYPRAVGEFSWPPFPEYSTEFLISAASVVFLLVISTILLLGRSHKKLVRGVPAKVPGPGIAKRHRRFLSPVESPWEGVRTLADLFEQTAKKNADSKCFGTRKVCERTMVYNSKAKREFEKLLLGEYSWITYGQALAQVQALSSGLVALGHKRKERAAIFADTRQEWLLALHACFRQSVTVVTVYASLGEEALVHALNETAVTTVFVDAKLLPKLAAVATRLPHLLRVVYIEFELHNDPLPSFPSSIQLESFTNLRQLGGTNPEDPYLPTGADVAVVMYTSGSTGTPKGVIMQHSSLVSASIGLLATMHTARKAWVVYLAYLPLAHVLELAAEHAILTLGAPLGYGSPATLSDRSNKIKKGSKGDAPVLRPTIIAAVPAIMDKMKEAVDAELAGGSALVRHIYNFAYDRRLAAFNRGHLGNLLEKVIYDRFVFGKIRNLLGGRVQLIVSGGAPLAEETQRFMNIAFSCPVLQGYGLTETCAIACLGEMDDLSVGRVGTPVPAAIVKLVDWEAGGYHITDKPLPRGEVHIGGPTVTLGYLNQPEKTAEDYYKDDAGMRWFRSGDIGQWHEDGTLQIFDRKKDIVKLQHGEYISLGKVEAVLASADYVRQVMVEVDPRRTFAVAIIVVHLKKLTAWAEEQPGLVAKAHDPDALCADKEVEAEVHRSIQKAARAARLEPVEVPKHVKLVYDPWTPENDLTTQALKLKRESVRKAFKKQIEELYA